MLIVSYRPIQNVTKAIGEFENIGNYIALNQIQSAGTLNGNCRADYNCAVNNYTSVITQHGCNFSFLFYANSIFHNSLLLNSFTFYDRKICSKHNK